MKKIRLLALALCLFMLPLTACKKGPDPFEGKTKVKVSVYAAGYGKIWIEEACRLYEEDFPDVKFEIEANPRMFDTIKTRLDANVCDSDIVLVANGDYRGLVSKGYLEDLSDVYEMVIPDTEDVKVKDVVPQSQQDYRIIDGKTYGIPWQDATATGFTYNKKMFASNGWDVPQTMDEFWELCDKIAATGIAPLTFGGGQQSAYTPNILNQWFVECYGYEYMNNTFLKYESPQQYADTFEGRLKVYETTAKLFNGKTTSGKNIVLSGSKGFTAQAAQRELIKGNAAMTICGQWFPTEMATFLENYPNFECGFMPVPHINSDKKTLNGEDSSTVRYSLDGNILSIPSGSKQKDIAKDFLVHMMTKKSYTSFVKANNGVLRPLNIDVDSSAITGFAKDAYDYYIKGKNADTFIYEVSLAPMATKGYLALLISENGNAILNLLNAKTYEAAMSAAATAAADDYPRASEMWDTSKNAWKDVYLGVS